MRARAEMSLEVEPEQVCACPRCGAPERVLGVVEHDGVFPIRLWTDGREDGSTPLRSPRVARCHACESCYWLADARRLGRAQDPQSPTAWRFAPLASPPSAKDLYRALAQGLYRDHGGVAARDARDELELRVLAWQADNDALRENGADAAGCAAVLLVPLAASLWPLIARLWSGRPLAPERAFLALFTLMCGALALKLAIDAARSRRAYRRARRRLADESGPFRDNLGILFERLDERDLAQRLTKAEVARQLGRFDDAARLVSGETRAPELAAEIRRLAEARDDSLSSIQRNR